MSRDLVWLKGRKLKRDDPFHMAQQYRYNMPIIPPLGLGTTTLSWICYIPLPSDLALLHKTCPAGYYGYLGTRLSVCSTYRTLFLALCSALCSALFPTLCYAMCSTL
jgi:hypothetical protein